jgi:hypothetical protein
VPIIIDSGVQPYYFHIETDSITLSAWQYRTIPPGDTKTAFPLSIVSGFTAGHTYAFSVDDFSIDEWNWEYGINEDGELLSQLEKEHKAHVAREEKEEVRDEWKGKGRFWKDGGMKGMLLFKCVEGAIVKTKWVEAWRGILGRRNLSGNKLICHLITPMNLAGNAEGEGMCCMWKWSPDFPSNIDSHRTNIPEVSGEWRMGMGKGMKVIRQTMRSKKARMPLRFQCQGIAVRKTNLVDPDKTLTYRHETIWI